MASDSAMRIASRSRGLRLMRAAAGVYAALTVLAGEFTMAQTPADTKTYENAQYRFGATLPSGCRHEEGPGTLDAICSPELDAARSGATSVAAALVLQVSAQSVPEDAGQTPGALAERYAEAEFKQELPEAVCGESDKARVKISSATQLLEDARVVYTAEVACPEVKFLALGVRSAQVRFLITPGMRYRLMARAPKEDFQQNKASIDAFIDSFRVLPAERTSQ